MKTLKRFLSVLLVLCLLVTGFSFAVSADFSNVSKIRKATYEELAGNSKVSDSNAKVVPPGFYEVYLDEPNFTSYYIVEKADGYLLTGTASNTFSRVRYSLTESNSLKKWKFNCVGSGVYSIYSYADLTTCLTVNPTTKAVTLSPSTGSDYQKWKICIGNNGNTLKCVSSDASVNNYMLVINGTSCSVSNSTYTPIGLFEVTWYTPTTSISYVDFYVAEGQSKYITPVRNPSDATADSDLVNWSTTNPDIMTVSSQGLVTGVAEGTATLTFEDRITQVEGSCTATVVEAGTVGILSIYAVDDSSSSSSSSSSSMTTPTSSSSSSSYLGHAFLSLEYYGSSSITLGGYEIATDTMITFGTFGQTQNTSAHHGVWINLEAYGIHNLGRYTNRVSLSMFITDDDIDTIGEQIAEHNVWHFNNNCTTFATRIWNDISPTYLQSKLILQGIDLPTTLYSSILAEEGYEINKSIPNPSEVGYVDDNGTFVSVDVDTFESFGEDSELEAMAFCRSLQKEGVISE